MICSNCGTENPIGAKFCNECAVRLAAACPTCGTANLPTAKFCSECATPLVAGASPNSQTTLGTVAAAAAQAPVAERRLVSILFADLVGFTPFAEERDAEDVRETLTRYFELASELVGRYGGTVEKFIGDAVMAVWGAPVAHEDDAERAVRAGLELVNAVRSLGPEIHARAGVLTGEAAVTLGATNQGMVAGDLVNTAARLQSVAPPGAVLVGEGTYRAASKAIAFEEAGQQTLKGKTAPVHAWRALRVVAGVGGRDRPETLEAPFVGRDGELQLLKDLFHATTREKRARLVSVMGPAGIGKSRLAGEFSNYLDGVVEQVWWHVGRSPAYGDGISFWALGEMVRARCGLLESDDGSTTRSKVAAKVRELIADEAERRWIEPALLALLGLESGVASEQLFAAWRTFFERVAATGPVAMVFEDLHFADSGLLDFIDHLLEWSKGASIYVLTLARPELLEKRPEWGAASRNFVSVHLEPLPEGEMRELLAGLVPGLPEAAMRTIVERADGVPLYAVETVRMLVADGKLALDDGVYRPTGELETLAIPESLTALIASRLDAIPPGDRAVVSDAAVLGQSFTLTALSSISGVPEPELEERIRVLIRRELLALDTDRLSPERGQYAFVQALIREVAYNTLSKRDRNARHLAAARFFESLGNDELAGALAGHYLAAHANASEGPEAEALAGQARIALRAAAERATALGSHDQALAFLDQAIRVAANPIDQADLHERAHHSAFLALHADAAERHARAARDLYRSSGDRAGEARATAEIAWILTGMKARPDEALALLETTLSELADLADTREGAMLMAALSRAYGLHEKPELMLDWAERSMVVAERHDLVDVIAMSLASRGSALLRLGRAREGVVTLRGASDLALAHGLTDVELRTRTLLTFYGQFDDPVDGLVMARAGQEIAQRNGSRTYGLYMAGNAASCAIRAGEWDWAVALCDEWLATDIGAAARVELAADRAMLEAFRGGDPAKLLEELGPLLDGLSDRQYDAYRQMAVAWRALADGRLAESSAIAEAAARVNIFEPMGLPLALRAAIWARDVPRAHSLLDALDSSGFRGRALEADQLSGRAGVAGLEGRIDEAAAGYREALTKWRDLELPWDEALTAIDMTSVLDPASPEARSAAERAREILSRLGAQPFLARLDEAMAREPAASRIRRPSAEEPTAAV